jgi:hypothetical protein
MTLGLTEGVERYIRFLDKKGEATRDQLKAEFGDEERDLFQEAYRLNLLGEYKKDGTTQVSANHEGKRRLSLADNPSMTEKGQGHWWFR